MQIEYYYYNSPVGILDIELKNDVVLGLKVVEFCEKEGMIVKDVCYENKSAIHGSKRPVFEEIIARQKTKDRVDAIMVYTLNRLTRNHPDFYFIRELVDKHNTKIIFVKENMIIQKPFKSYEKYFFRT